MAMPRADPGKRDVALVLTARNSLMSTYVLYEMIAFLGSGYGEFLSRLENGDLHLIASLTNFGDVLGDVQVVYRQPGGEWRDAGALGYIGPIARATRGLSFSIEDPNAPVEVELRFARAHWKFDTATLAPVLATNLKPEIVEPEVADAKGRDPKIVEASLRGEGPYLLTSPGDEITLRFPVAHQARGSVGYFLKSRGYYYEWMRDDWLRAEDPERAQRYIDDPARAYRELAASYREIEPNIEAVFRSSRFSGVNKGAQ
jgi:hypothetical protein